MNLTTKMRYGSRVMVQLAGGFPDETISVKEMAREQNVSEKYLERIIAALKARGLVKSVRGVGGGYLLSRQPGEIRMLDVFEAVEGPTALVACVDDADECERSSFCPTRGLWVEMTRAMTDVLERTTLRSLADNAPPRPDSV